MVTVWLSGKVRVSSFFPIVSRRLVKKRTETCNVGHLGGVDEVGGIKLLRDSCVGKTIPPYLKQAAWISAGGRRCGFQRVFGQFLRQYGVDPSIVSAMNLY
jgi:hypothetical protein